MDALNEAVELAQEQYRGGLTDFQNVLDVQRSLFNLEDNLARSEGQVFQNLIVLFRSTGGGWCEATQDVATKTSSTTSEVLTGSVQD